MGAWKDADHKHAQAAGNVVRLQASLDQAVQREQAAALILAQAERAERAATEAMARAKELGLAAEGDSNADSDKDKASPKFTSSWDHELPDGLE